MFAYVFVVSFFYCLMPNSFTAFLWMIAIAIGAFINAQNEKLKDQVKHRAD